MEARLKKNINLSKYFAIKGKTQKEVALLSGVSTETIRRISDSGHSMRIATAGKIALALDVEIEDIFDITKEGE